MGNNKNNHIVQHVLTETEVGYRKNILTTKGLRPEQIVKFPQFPSKSGVHLRGSHSWRRGLEEMPW